MTVSERKQREKKAREERIIRAAERILFAEGFGQTSMSDIADAAELSKGTLYLYFKSKDDLLHAIIARGLKILLEKFKKVISSKKKGIQKLMAIGQAYYSFCQENPKYFSILLLEETHKHTQEYIDSNPFIKECEKNGTDIFGLIVEVIKIGLADGSIKTSIDPLKLAFILWGDSTGVMQIIRNKGAVLMHFGLKPEDLFASAMQILKTALSAE